MKEKLIFGLPSLIVLHSFTIFPEYFISISIIYVLIASVLITNNVYNFLIQNVFSNCIAVILFMSSYLIFNDDLLTVKILSFSNSFVNDYFGYFTKLTLCLFSSFFFCIIGSFLKEQKLTSFEYLLLILFAVLGFLLMCSSNDLLTGYLAIELSAFSLYILASFKKVSSYSIDAGIKYFIIGAISSAFYLLGSSFIYGFSGSINFSDLQNLFNCSSNFIPNFSFYFVLNFKQSNFITDNEMFLNSLSLYKISTIFSLFNINFLEWGLSLIILSLFIKLALAPFHLWSLDVYESSPTTSTFFFAVLTKLSVFVLLLRLCYQSFFSLKNCWQFYSIWIGIFSIFIGSLGGLTQRKLKTLLAYSSTSHMGYILISFATGTYIGIQMFLFYFLLYMISGLCVWYCFLLIRLKQKIFKNKYSKELSDLVLLKKSNLGLSFCLTITMFSIAGIPPVIGFLAKTGIFLTVVGISFYYIALFSISCSVISTFYYIRIIKTFYFETVLVGKLYYPINTLNTVILSFLIFLLVFLFLNPTFLYLISCKSILCFL